MGRSEKTKRKQQELAQQLIQEFDANGDGELDLKEFLKLSFEFLSRC